MKVSIFLSIVHSYGQHILASLDEVLKQPPLHHSKQRHVIGPYRILGSGAPPHKKGRGRSALHLMWRK
jgi:hypothetical protein